MRRRDVITLLSSAVACAFPARAQQPAKPVIGYLGPETPASYGSRLKAFRKGLAEAGYVEGGNVEIEFRWAEGQYTRLAALAAELVERQVTVIVAPGGAEIGLAAKAATSTIPVVFELGGDPIALGLVGNLSRPEGNLTGVSSLSVGVTPKRLEFMHQALPNAGVFAVAINPKSPTSNSQLRSLQTASEALGLQLRVLHASTEPEIEALFTAMSQQRASGLVFTSDPYFAYRSEKLAELAIRHAVPAITQSRDFPMAGGLMSYGGDFEESHRYTGVYAGRILKGRKVSDLPVQQVTKVEMLVNLKTAASLGIAIPSSLVTSADIVIE